MDFDELVPHESNVSAKRNHGRKYDETRLDKICALLWDTYTYGKVGETPYSNTFSESGRNNKVGIVLLSYMISVRFIIGLKLRIIRRNQIVDMGRLL